MVTSFTPISFVLIISIKSDYVKNWTHILLRVFHNPLLKFYCSKRVSGYISSYLQKIASGLELVSRAHLLYIFFCQHQTFLLLKILNNVFLNSILRIWWHLKFYDCSLIKFSYKFRKKWQVKKERKKNLQKFKVLNSSDCYYVQVP